MTQIVKTLMFNFGRTSDWFFQRYVRRQEERRRNLEKRVLIDRLLDLHKRACQTAIKEKLFERWQQQDVVLRCAIEFYRECSVNELNALEARYVGYFRSIPSKENLK